MKFLSTIRQATAAALVGFGLFGMIAGPAAALTIPQQFSPTLYPSQQTHYLRFALNFNSCVPVSLACSVKVGAVPYNAFLVRAFTQTYTTFSGGGVTAFAASFGTTSANANEILTTTPLLTAADAVTVTLTHPGATATGNGIVQTGANGGFDIWVKLTATTGSPTAGSAVGIIEYIAPNDGSCTMVPMTQTAPGC